MLLIFLVPLIKEFKNRLKQNLLDIFIRILQIMQALNLSRCLEVIENGRGGKTMVFELSQHGGHPTVSGRQIAWRESAL